MAAAAAPVRVHWIVPRRRDCGTEERRAFLAAAKAAAAAGMAANVVPVAGVAGGALLRSVAKRKGTASAAALAWGQRAEAGAAKWRLRRAGGGEAGAAGPDAECEYKSCREQSAVM
jgi:hypothetical protein